MIPLGGFYLTRNAIDLNQPKLANMAVTTPPTIRHAVDAARVSAPELPAKRPEVRWRKKAAGVLLLLLGVSILASWGIWLADPTRNPLAEGVGTIQDGQYTVFLLVAETLMATTALLGGWGVFRGYWWGTRVAHVAIGLMVYSTLYTLGFSLLREPFLTPIMLGGLAGAIAAFALLWIPDAAMPATVEPRRVAAIRISGSIGEVSHVGIRTSLIRVGGVISLLFFVLHIQFWSAFDWPGSLTVLPGDGAAIVQTLNVTVAVTMLLFAYVSLFRARALLTPGLGRALSLAIALFWVARAVSGTVFFGFSLVEVFTFLVVAALYAVPQLGSRAPANAEGR